MGIEADRHREAIKRTVERVSPNIEIDTTKVLTEAEIAEFRRQCDERATNKALAEKEGRQGLRDRIRRAANQTRRFERDKIDPGAKSSGDA